jgi:hypothetical protein
MRVYDGSVWIPASAASQAILSVYKYTATSGQTTFSGADDNAVTLAYTAGSILVTLNGVLLEDTTDYTATNGTSVVLSVAAALNDEVNIHAFSTFDLASLTLNNPSINGTVSTTGINFDSNTLVIDATNDRVGIGTSSPQKSLHLVGNDGTVASFPTVGGKDFLIVENNGNSNVNIIAGSSATSELKFTDSGASGARGSIGYNHSDDSLSVAAGGTERMRIDSSGTLLIGTTNTDPTFNRVNGLNLLAGGRIYSRSNGSWDIGRDVTSGLHITFYTDNGSARVTAGNISSNGSTTAYNTASDYRMKENIAPMTGALATVSQLNPVTYDWKDEFVGTKKSSQGFIAHELQAVVPDCVTGEKDAVDADGKPVYQGVDTSFLVATLTAAIKEQQAIIESLKARLDAAGL